MTNTNPNNNNHRVSPFTSVSLSLGTGEECKVNNPPNLSHLSNEHLQGLWVSVNEERNNRKNEEVSASIEKDLKEIKETLLDIGLEPQPQQQNYVDRK
jgi:hypothetical protein